VPLAIEFPPTSAEWTFFVAAAVILLEPLLVERIGLPGNIGVILGGLLVGPFALGCIESDLAAVAVRA
jgi:Kef-type K+ transport system membrane component KefB